MTHRIITDIQFLEESRDEFTTRGRYSSTCMLRTAFALNPEMTRKQAVAVLTEAGWNESTVRIQFAASRKESAQFEDTVVTDDGSLMEVA